MHRIRRVSRSGRKSPAGYQYREERRSERSVPTRTARIVAERATLIGSFKVDDKALSAMSLGSDGRSVARRVRTNRTTEDLLFSSSVRVILHSSSPSGWTGCTWLSAPSSDRTADDCCRPKLSGRAHFDGFLPLRSQKVASLHAAGNGNMPRRRVGLHTEKKGLRRHILLESVVCRASKFCHFSC